ncbi:hypothetical protein [Microbacterium lacticum]
MALMLGAFLSLWGADAWPWAQPLASLRPLGFAAELYASNVRVQMFVLIGLYGCAISVVLGTSLYLVGGATRILAYLRQLPVPPLAEAVRMRLRPLADLHLHISRDWTVGVLFFAVLFGSHVDAFSLLVVGLVALIALALFFIPQMLLRDVIIRAHRRATDSAMTSWQRLDSLGRPVQPGDMAALTELSLPPRYWVYGSSEFMFWLLAQAVAVIALVYQITR